MPDFLQKIKSRQNFIAVIADDFSGAAELAGLSLRYGLSVDICFNEVKSTNKDVLVISTDSRSFPLQKALQVNKTLLEKVLLLNPSFIYKKTDSALRGHIIAELRQQMELTKKISTLFIPANPSLNRIIKDGNYYINNELIHTTAFGNDPEFPINVSSIAEHFSNQVTLKRIEDYDNQPGITVGVVAETIDLQKWTTALSDMQAVAGAGDFYEAILSNIFEAVVVNNVQPAIPFLYVCGTAHKERKTWLHTVSGRTRSVVYINNDNAVNDAIGILSSTGKLILAIDEAQLTINDTAEHLRQQMAEVVHHITKNISIAEIFIEGGSTAAAVIEKANITKVEVVGEWQRGVVRMKADAFFISVKPGSYALPRPVYEYFS